MPRNLHSLVQEVMLLVEYIGEWAYKCHLVVAREFIGDGLKDSIRRSVDRTRDSFARTRILVVEEDFAGECRFLSWEK